MEQILTPLQQFQKAHFNHLGLPLDIDDVLGPETRWAKNVATLSMARREPIYEGRKFLGLKEFPPGSNDDPKGIIDGWLKRCQAPEGEPWCASALSAWLSVSVLVKIPGAQNLGRHFPAVTEPFAGDIYWFPTGTQGHGHCGLVVGVSALEVMGYEGNSNNMCACVRRRRSGLRFARPFPDLIGVCPGVIDDVPLAGGGTR